jgi:hypothetical protein
MNPSRGEGSEGGNAFDSAPTTAAAVQAPQPSQHGNLPATPYNPSRTNQGVAGFHLPVVAKIAASKSGFIQVQGTGMVDASPKRLEAYLGKENKLPLAPVAPALNTPAHTAAPQVVLPLQARTCDHKRSWKAILVHGIVSIRTA